MIASRSRQQGLFVLLLCAGAVVLGALIVRQPTMAVALMAAGALVAFAFAMPVALLTLLLFVTAIVPYDVQNAWSFSPIGSEAGLLLSDALLIMGLLRAGVVVLRTPVDLRSSVVGGGIVILLVVASVQAARGYGGGAAVSVAGFELRSLLGWGAFLIAVPIVGDPAARARLFKGLLVVGLALGCWGLLQYFGSISLLEGGDAGTRSNLEYTDAISVQGGLFGFPVALLIAVSVLSSVRLPSRTRALVVGVVALNALSLLLTYERTFWLAVVVALGLLAVKTGLLEQLKLVVLAVGAVIVTLAVLSAVAPGALTAAEQRVLSLAEYGGGNSLRARIVESREVLAKIDDAPLAGSGLADEIRWGMAWVNVPAQNTPFSHNGYLWLAWKLGIPAALLLVVLVVWGVFSRAAGSLPLIDARVRDGAQASLLAMLIVTLMFPALRQLSATAVLGVLLALCFTPAVSPRAPALHP